MRSSGERDPAPRRVRLLGLGAVAVGAAGLLVPFGPFAAGAGGQTTSAVSGVASAAGVNALFEVPQFLPLGDALVDLGIPTAQAALETGGGQQAGFASLPDPGELVLTLPGTAAGLVGGFGALPAPSYPLAVSSSQGQPLGRFSDPAGVIVLESRSSDQQVVASASITNPGAAPSVGKVIASASVEEDRGGTVRATAETRVEGFALDVAGVSIRLGTITSRSTTTLAAGADEPTTTTDFDIAGATVNGLGISIGPDGVSIADQKLPLPLGELGKIIDGLLGQAGVNFELVTTTAADGGSASQYLEVRTRQTLPVPGDPVGTVYLRIGRVESSLVAGLAPTPDLGGGAPPAFAGDGGFDVGTTSGGAVALPTPGAPTVVDRPGVAIDGDPVALALDLRRTFRFFYSVLIVGGLAGIASASIWRTKGVRARWMP